MQIRALSTLLFLVAAVGLHPGAQARRRRGYFRIIGRPTHGINLFNNRRIVDFAPSSRVFGALGGVPEIGALAPGAANASLITAATPRSTSVAVIDAWQLRTSFGLPRGAGPFNVPAADAPTLFFGSQNVTDRLAPRSFADSAAASAQGAPYRAAGALPVISVAKWNGARAELLGRCAAKPSADSPTTVTVRLRGGLPNALYSMLDVGVTHALTDREAPSVVPFGGVPNVLATDEWGNGEVRRKLAYCPLDQCAGSQRCTLYVSLFYNFDHVVYGGAPSLDAGGATVGMVGSNQVQMFFNGESL